MRNITARLHAMLVGFIVLVLVLFMVSIGLRFVTRFVLVDRFGMDNAFTHLVLSDEAKVLRVDQGIAAIMPGYDAVRSHDVAGTLDDFHRRYLTMFRRVTDNVSNYANQQLVFRRPIVEAANGYEKLINWNLAGYSEYNNVIDLGDGYLTTFMNWVDVWANVEAVLEFKEYLDDQAIPMLFVQIPNKISRQDTIVNNVVDFYNENANQLVGWLDDYGVNILDLRDYAEQQHLDYRSIFYNTDHHWRVEAGLWAAGVIGEELNKSFDFKIAPDLFSPENFAFDYYEKAFLGSLGKKVTLARATPDDFALIYPKFDVDLTLKIPSINLEATGGFDIIFDYSQLEIDDLYQREMYGMYLHSALTQHGFIRLENNLPQGDARNLLVVGDSFGYVLAPYLALEFNNLDFVDLRHYTESLRDLIAVGSYDMIIISYSSLFRVEYDSGRSMYDFR